MVERLFLKLSNSLFRLLLVVACLLIFAANYSVFIDAPNERIMGPVQRIFYFHVGSAVSCYFSFAIVLVSSVLYLKSRKEFFDILNEAAGEVGFAFCSMVLVSGMIWGHAAWNTWFSWEPRLVSFLLLWLIFLAFNLLRVFGDPTRLGAHSAVLGIVGAITVPIVVFSIKLLPAVQQLHPRADKGAGGFLDPAFIPPLLVSMAGLVVFQFLLVTLRTKIGILSERVQGE